jgi:hypothetical protein
LIKKLQREKKREEELAMEERRRDQVEVGAVHVSGFFLMSSWIFLTPHRERVDLRMLIRVPSCLSHEQSRSLLAMYPVPCDVHDPLFIFLDPHTLCAPVLPFPHTFRHCQRTSRTRNRLVEKTLFRKMRMSWQILDLLSSFLFIS